LGEELKFVVYTYIRALAGTEAGGVTLHGDRVGVGSALERFMCGLVIRLKNDWDTCKGSMDNDNLRPTSSVNKALVTRSMNEDN